MEDGLATTVTVVSAVSTPAEKCAGIFKTADPIAKKFLSQGACELPCDMRGDTPREIRKNKDIHTKGMVFKFCLLKFQEIRGYVQDKDDTKASLPTTSAKDALLSNIYLCKLLLTGLKAMYYQRAINIPKL